MQLGVAVPQRINNMDFLMRAFLYKAGLELFLGTLGVIVWCYRELRMITLGHDSYSESRSVTGTSALWWTVPIVSAPSLLDSLASLPVSSM